MIKMVFNIFTSNAIVKNDNIVVIVEITTLRVIDFVRKGRNPDAYYEHCICWPGYDYYCC